MTMLRGLLARIAAAVSGVRAVVTAARGRKRAVIAVLAGSLSVLAFAPFHVFPVLFLTLPLLVWLVDGSETVAEAGAAGWLFGFGYFLLNLFWIGEAFLVEAEKFAWAMPFAVTLLPAGMALFWALATAAARRFWTGNTDRVVTLAIALSSVEWLRGHILTGLPWNVLGYALTYPLALMQSAALLGVYALGLPAILIFGLPLVLIADARNVQIQSAVARALAIMVVPIGMLWGFGALRLASHPRQDVANVKLRIVQPSVPQREKWQPDHQRAIFEQHLEMSATSPAGVRDDLNGVTHVIWPEAAMPFLPLEVPEATDAIGMMLPPGTSLVSGALRRALTPEGRQFGYNSLLVFDDTGRSIANYDKVHLVPFGEYLPYADWLGALGLSKLTKGLGSFESGPLPRPVLTIPGLPPVGGLICYEVLFPGEVLDDAHRPGLLINVTNDGWFGDTTGPRQHYHQARVRAVEEGLPLVRAANNGISAVFDPLGRVLGWIGMNEKAVLDSALPAALPPPPYARYRDAFFFAVLGLAVLLQAIRRQFFE